MAEPLGWCVEAVRAAAEPGLGRALLALRTRHSRRPGGAARFRERGGLGPLLELLGPDRPRRTLDLALSVLGNCCTEPGCRRLARSLGGVPRLVSLLAPPSPESVRCRAARALANLALEPDGAQEVLEAGAAPLLLSLAASCASPQCLHSAARALRILGAAPCPLQPLGPAAAIRTLATRLAALAPDHPACPALARALRALTDLPGPYVDEVAPAVPTLVALAAHAKRDRRQPALAALANACARANLRPGLGAAGAVEAAIQEVRRVLGVPGGTSVPGRQDGVAPSSAPKVVSKGRLAPPSALVAPNGALPLPSGTLAPPSGALAPPSSTTLAPPSALAPPNGALALFNGTLAPSSSTLASPSATLASSSDAMVPPSVLGALSGTLAPPNGALAPSSDLESPNGTLAPPSTALVPPGATLTSSSDALVAPSTTLAPPSSSRAPKATLVPSKGTLAPPSTTTLAPPIPSRISNGTLAPPKGTPAGPTSATLCPAVRALCLLCREAVNRARVRAAGGLGVLLALLGHPLGTAWHRRLLLALAAFAYDQEALLALEGEGLAPRLAQVLRGQARSGWGRRRGRRRQEEEEEEEKEEAAAASWDLPREETPKGTPRGGLGSCLYLFQSPSSPPPSSSSSSPPPPPPPRPAPAPFPPLLTLALPRGVGEGDPWLPETPALLLLRRLAASDPPSPSLARPGVLGGLLSYLTALPPPPPAPRAAAAALLRRLTAAPCLLGALLSCYLPSLLSSWLLLGLPPRRARSLSAPGGARGRRGQPRGWQHPRGDRLRELGEALLSSLGRAAAAPYGLGVLQHLLRCGSPRARLACATALPLLARVAPPARALLWQGGAVALLLSAVALGPSSPFQPPPAFALYAADAIGHLRRHQEDTPGGQQGQVPGAAANEDLQGPGDSSGDPSRGPPKRPLLEASSCPHLSPVPPKRPLLEASSCPQPSPAPSSPCPSLSPDPSQSPPPAPPCPCPYSRAPHDLLLLPDGARPGVPASRAALCQLSPVLAAMLGGAFAEARQAEVTLGSAPRGALRLLLHFLHGCRGPPHDPCQLLAPPVPPSPAGAALALARRFLVAEDFEAWVASAVGAPPGMLWALAERWGSAHLATRAAQAILKGGPEEVAPRLVRAARVAQCPPRLARALLAELAPGGLQPPLEMGEPWGGVGDPLLALPGGAKLEEGEEEELGEDFGEVLGEDFWGDLEEDFGGDLGEDFGDPQEEPGSNQGDLSSFLGEEEEEEEDEEEVL
ncbi:armadillo repeat-containing protein 5-like [Pogoniulus pusillus]|uniref:armadillo repeat-containing protein 5-like n=1 Tax=Pogoniulus pusillus TaxID=488313 RepID=UPI0030B9720E